MSTAAKTRRYLRRKHKVNSIIKSSCKSPRLIVNRSNAHISVQVVDQSWIVLAHASDTWCSGTKSEKAFQVGELIASKLLSKSISKVVFDRNWYLYHWRVKQVAEWARSWGVDL